MYQMEQSQRTFTGNGVRFQKYIQRNPKQE